MSEDKPWLDDGDVRVYAGDCIEVMRGMEAESIDAVVCDPPYGLDFMGRAWDTGAVAFAVETWTEALRVLKPGGHLLAFGGTRTYHRLTCAIEDAGFEVRDCLSWNYGSGFPKSLDVSKAIDKAAGVEREVVGPSARHVSGKPEQRTTGLAGSSTFAESVGMGAFITAPATPEAARWQGWGTALKPAWEPVVMARKPLAGTVAANVQQHGTGALNVDGCRVGGERRFNPPTRKGATVALGSFDMCEGEGSPVEGRWPANVVLDEAAAELLDAQSGERPTRPGPVGSGSGNPAANVPFVGGVATTVYTDTGGASRFFYTAKASSAERGAANTHPTVKPVALMRWLVRMVTPPGGLVLDPFAGSGTTGVAARAEGFRCVLIEREPEYLPIIAERLSQLSLLGGTA